MDFGKRKAISGALTSLVLLTASIVISLVVVGFTFGNLTYSPSPTLKQNGQLFIVHKGGIYCLTGEVSSTGKVTIDSISVNSYAESANVEINEGVNNLSVTLPSGFTPEEGEHYNVVLGLSDGYSLNAYAYYE
jgi:hypothetical protein